VTVETHLHRARERVESERATLAAKRDGLDAFAATVRETATAGPGGSTVSGTVTSPVAVGAGGAGVDHRDDLRSAFTASVGRHAESDSTLAALRAELGDDVALALAPTTEVRFTQTLQNRLLSAVTARQQELSVTCEVLDREADHLTETADTVDEVVDWLTTADETPLSALGFEALAERHERLDTHRGQCAALAADRQELLAGTTSHAAQVGVAHDSLVESLYEDFPVTYPVLSTVTRLVEVCADAQQAVRAHLVRRA